MNTNNDISSADLLTVAAVLNAQAFALLEQHNGDAAFEQRAQELFILANKFHAKWHELNK